MVYVNKLFNKLFKMVDGRSRFSSGPMDASSPDSCLQVKPIFVEHYWEIW